jgi:hypothetical protein
MAARRRELLQRLVQRFDEPSGFDWDALREGKRRAWPAPPEHYGP